MQDPSYVKENKNTARIKPWEPQCHSNIKFFSFL
jgi:hypothetical protein